ncbi:MAG: hypothetical protein GWP42_05345 [Verrucomicrobiales bacterium]|nr:hypothetical protein [Verrucomicrobiales bacterium]
MKTILLAVLLFVIPQISTFAQIGDDGTGIVNGYNIGPNAILIGADLNGADLKGANLTRANLTDAILEGADLSNSALLGTELGGANIQNANLQEANLGRANLSGADLSNSNLKNSKIEQSLLVNTTLKNTNLTNALIFNSNLSGADFTGSNMYKVLSGYIVGRPSALPEGWILSIDGSFLVGFGANLRAAELTNTRYLGSVLTALTEKAFEKISTLESNASELIPKTESNAERSAANALIIDALKTQIDNMSAKLETLVASVAEKDDKIAELKKRPTLEQIRDARAGSIVLTVEPVGQNITLGLTIE